MDSNERLLTRNSSHIVHRVMTGIQLDGSISGLVEVPCKVKLFSFAY
jgi:hypothetical protein